MSEYKEYLLDNDYAHMTEFCKPDEDDIHVIEYRAYEDLKKQIEILEAQLREAIK